MTDQRIAPLASSQSLTIIASDDNRQSSVRDQHNMKKIGTNSAFTVQLLAMRHSAAAYRQKRRATPEEAKIAYTAISRLAPVRDASISFAA